MPKKIVLAVAACLALPAAAHAAPLPISGTLDLGEATAANAVRWAGPEVNGLAGTSVAGVGDFDGDGKADMAVGEPKRDTGAGPDTGTVYIVTDPAAGGNLEGAAIAIRGARAGERAGFAVHAAGDVNQDGKADVIVGAPYGGGPAVESRGAAYVVFGRTDRAEINLNGDFGGFVIQGGNTGDVLGRSVGSIGDLNGDTIPELLVGAPARDVADRPDAGTAFVVYGKKDGAPVDVSRLVEEKKGWQVNGPVGSSVGGAYAGRSINSIGDLTGDGRPELLVSAPRAGTAIAPTARPKGIAYVVWGRSDAGVTDLQNLGVGGYSITGKATDAGPNARRTRNGDFLAESIEPVGDVNGDGRPDMVAGAHLADAPDRTNIGVSYVLYGKGDAAPVDVDSLGAGGFRITGIDEQDQTGFDTAAAGDFNADGLDDIVVSSLFAEPVSRKNAGAVYIVWGSRGAPRDLDLAASATRALRVAGAKEQDGLGYSVASIGDVNGDAAPDLALGVPAVNTTDALIGRSKRAGGAYVVFGATSRPEDHPADALSRDPGYVEAVRRGCRGALNVQVLMEDNGYTDRSADPQRIRRTGLEAYIASPRNDGTVIGVTGFDSGDDADQIIEPSVIDAKGVDAMLGALRKEVDGQDSFPGYPFMVRTFATDNPGSTARILLVDGYLFRDMDEYDGLTEGNPPTYIIGVGEPEDRDASDIRELRRLARDTKGRFYLAKTPRAIEKAFQAIESRLRCDLEADDFTNELEPGEAETEQAGLEPGVRSVDVRLTWRDPKARFEIDRLEVVRNGEVTERKGAEQIRRAYASEADAELEGAKGPTFRTLHLSGVTSGGRLRVVLKSPRGRRAGTVYARITQSRTRD